MSKYASNRGDISNAEDDDSASANISQANSEKSILPFAESINRLTVPGKRKPIRSIASLSRFKRLKLSYNAKYLSLLNNVIEDLGNSASIENLGSCPATQMGMSTWRSQEKDSLFRALARRGSDDLPGLANAVGTKSELEIRAYLDMLQQAMTRSHLNGSRPTLVTMSEIPAAVEVSPDCCIAMEQAADALALLQKRTEERNEKQKYATLWKLDDDAAEWVETRIDKTEADYTELKEKLPAAEILRLKNFLELSACVFMNSTDPERNWRTFAERDQKPSIMYTAFSDMYGIVISIVKRLVQSSLFFAMSRLRATRSSKHAHKQAVRRKDVNAALDALSMKRGAAGFWIGAARRCSLDVSEYGAGNSAKMDYPQVENFLSQRLSDSRGTSVSASARRLQSYRLTQPDLTTQMDRENRIFKESSPELGAESAHKSLSPSYLPSSQSRSENGSTTDEDDYLDYVDREASKNEEASLWKILGEDRPHAATSESGSMPKEPAAYRKNREDLENWRHWLDYQPEWEAYNITNLNADLVANRKPKGLWTKALKERQQAELSNPNRKSRSCGNREVARTRKAEREREIRSDDQRSELTEGDQIMGATSSDEKGSNIEELGAERSLIARAFVDSSGDEARISDVDAASSVDGDGLSREHGPTDLSSDSTAASAS